MISFIMPSTLVIQSKRLAIVMKRHEHTELGWIVTSLIWQAHCIEVCETSQRVELAFLPS